MDYSDIKGVIFDLGSTLIEYENRSWIEISYEGQKMAYQEMGHLDHKLPDFEAFNDRLEEIKDEFRERARRTLKEWTASDGPVRLFAELGVENPEEEGRRFLDIFYRLVREQISACEGALETLAEIKKKGLKTGLISNTIFPGYLHDGDLKHLGLGEYLDFRIYSCEFGVRKPHPDIFRSGLTKIGLEPEETLYIGDRYLEDIEGPLDLGMGVVLKYRNGRDYPDPMPDGFPIIDRLPELLDILAGTAPNHRKEK